MIHVTRWGISCHRKDLMRTRPTDVFFRTSWPSLMTLATRLPLLFINHSVCLKSYWLKHDSWVLNQLTLLKMVVFRNELVGNMMKNSPSYMETDCSFLYRISWGPVLSQITPIYVFALTPSSSHIREHYFFCFHSIIPSQLRKSTRLRSDYGRGFETRWTECFLSIYIIPPATPCPGVHSACNNLNEHQRRK